MTSTSEIQAMTSPDGSGGEAEQPAGGVSYAIVAATFYEDLVGRLVNGATEAFHDAGVPASSVRVFEVTGAFELPLAAKACAESGEFAGVACVGVVIRGETNHYDYVCAETARGIMDVGLATGVPCSFGVITCDTREQAEARAGGDKRDQGRHAAEAVLAAVAVRDELGD